MVSCLPLENISLPVDSAGNGPGSSDIIIIHFYVRNAMYNVLEKFIGN